MVKKKRKSLKKKNEAIIEKSEVIIEKKLEWPELKENQYFAIIYNNKNGSLQIGGHIITFNNPLITKNPHGLPVEYESLKGIKGAEIQIIDNLSQFKSNIEKKIEKKEKEVNPEISQDGVMWVGDTLYKTTAYGQFKKDKPQFGLSKEAVKELVSTGRFVRVRNKK